MGYVPLFCVGCAGPVDHGFGVDGGLEESRSRHAEAAAEAPQPSQPPPAADAVEWGLPVAEMQWLTQLRVVHSGGVTEKLEYEDYGMADDDNGMYGLNPIAWEGEQWGVPFHADCLAVAEKTLAARKGPPSTMVELATRYHKHVASLYVAHQHRPKKAAKKVAGAAAGDPAAAAAPNEPPTPDAGEVLLNALIPGVQYGDGVLMRCDQFYDFEPGFEWLVRSPLAADEAAARNHARIVSVIGQLCQVCPE